MNLAKCLLTFPLAGLTLACGQSPSSGTDATSEGPSSTSGDTETSNETVGATTGDDTAGPTGEPEPEPEPEPATMTFFDEVVFYDGYAGLVDEPVPEGIIRLRNSLVARKLTDDQLDAIQNTLHMDVVIGALCDNYDRIGSVNLALTEKGVDIYEPDAATRLELGRFITPFMDMNKQPDEVLYAFDLAHVVPILKSPSVRETYDLWVELDVFGVPYAANDEVAGCAGRNDVFRGTVQWTTDSSQPAQDFDMMLPIAAKEAFNNYAEGASDELGTTTKTKLFLLDADASVQLVLITSNHGANAGGEEYSRRTHYVYIDGFLLHYYKPGRETCEPFRVYNTQANGIYGPNPKNDDQWQAFSNWCPGDVIDTRTLEVGPLPAGPHEFRIEVPDATFNGGEGNFPFSLFVQGKTSAG